MQFTFPTDSTTNPCATFEPGLKHKVGKPRRLRDCCEKINKGTNKYETCKFYVRQRSGRLLCGRSVSWTQSHTPKKHPRDPGKPVAKTTAKTHLPPKTPAGLFSYVVSQYTRTHTSTSAYVACHFIFFINYSIEQQQQTPTPPPCAHNTQNS